MALGSSLSLRRDLPDAAIATPAVNPHADAADAVLR
jgi:hypothetical protein